MADWAICSAASARLAACWAIFSSVLARPSWIRSPSYCSLSELIWVSSFFACAIRSCSEGFGCATPIAPVTLRASAVITAAATTWDGLRTALDNIGNARRCQPTRQKFYLTVRLLTGSGDLVTDACRRRGGYRWDGYR